MKCNRKRAAHDLHALRHRRGALIRGPIAHHATCAGQQSTICAAPHETEPLIGIQAKNCLYLVVA